MAPSTLRQWSPSVCGRPTLYPLKPYFYTLKTYFIYPHTGPVPMCVWTDGWKYVGILGGLQGRVPGTVRYFDKVHDWVKVACVSVCVCVCPGRKFVYCGT